MAEQPLRLLKFEALLARMSRLGEWLEKLVTGVVCMLLLVLFEQDPELYFWLIPSLALYTASLAAGSHQLSLVKQEDSKTGADFTIYIP